LFWLLHYLKKESAQMKLHWCQFRISLLLRIRQQHGDFGANLLPVRESQHLLKFELHPVAPVADAGHGANIFHEERSETGELGEADDSSLGAGGSRTAPALDLQIADGIEGVVPALLGAEPEEVVLFGRVDDRRSLRSALRGIHDAELLEGEKHVTAKNVGAPVPDKEDLVGVVVMHGVGVKELLVESLNGLLQPVDGVLVTISEHHVLGASSDTGLEGPPLDGSGDDPVLEPVRANFAAMGQESYAT
jgi:hypothetical protein